jgi:sensor c-di-GMP phosphodiesterase-like protein
MKPDAQVIVRAILGLAKGFGLQTTAESVEDAGQLAYLKANAPKGRDTCSAKPSLRPISRPF